METSRAEVGAANGHGNARSVADILSAVSLGGKVGRNRLLSQKTIDLIFEEQSKGFDLATGSNIRFGIGYALPGRDTSLEWLPEGPVSTSGGYGGSIIIDVDRGLLLLCNEQNGRCWSGL